MSHHLNTKFWLIGSGFMAIEYAKVLQAQNIDFDVIGRGTKSATSFTNKTNIPVHQGGLQSYLDQDVQTPDAAIVAVTIDQLAESTLSLLKYGVKRILVEKPAGLNLKEINQIANEADETNSEVFVAYNRRFFASTLKAQDIIASDGGVTSFSFEFTEWSHIIENLEMDQKIKEQWFLANSTHVVDLAFYLGGEPKEISCYIAGGLSWHPSASIFAGSGVTTQGALFSYQANWEAPGRWGLEIITCKHRLIFRPLEKLQIQKIGSLVVEDVKLNDELERRFKPGLFLQVDSFITGKNQDKLDLIATHRDLTERIFDKMIYPEI